MENSKPPDCTPGYLAIRVQELVELIPNEIHILQNDKTFIVDLVRTIGYEKTKNYFHNLVSLTSRQEFLSYVNSIYDQEITDHKHILFQLSVVRERLQKFQ